jgi:hypothetical protein
LWLNDDGDDAGAAAGDGYDGDASGQLSAE